LKEILARLTRSESGLGDFPYVSIGEVIRGFSQDAWERRLGELLEFRRREGHVNVPRGWPKNPRLATWVANQRRLIAAGDVDEHRLRLLRDAGVSWEGLAARREAQQAAWDRMFAAFRASTTSTVSPELAAWIAKQRFLRKSGALPEDREAKLKALGFEWTRPSAPAEEPDLRARAWERSVQSLRDYKSVHGDCAVPARWSGDRRLAQWVSHQRSLRKQGRLARERIEELDRLGFLWSAESTSRDRRWDERFGALAAFAKRHGHCNVPLGWRDDRSLAAWVSRQRSDRRRGVLRPDRQRRLESLRFEWAPVESQAQRRKKTWETMFAALKNSRRPDRELARWIAAQRRLHQKGRLSADRRRRLEEAGVAWTSREQKWEAKFAELQAWRRIHGDCNVPMAAEKGGALARWISAQRADFKAGRLAAHRIARLKAIDFVWTSAAAPLRFAHASR